MKNKQPAKPKKKQPKSPAPGPRRGLPLPAAAAAAAADPDDIYLRLKALFVADGMAPGRVTRIAPIFTANDGGLGYTEARFRGSMEPHINHEFDCHNPTFRTGQLAADATVGDCRDKIIEDHGQ